MAEYTKEQLVGWANILIEETHTDISISRTDAHAESYRVQLALLKIALAALTASPFGFTEGEGHGMVYEPRHADRLNYPSAVYRLPLLEGLK